MVRRAHHERLKLVRNFRPSAALHSQNKKPQAGFGGGFKTSIILRCGAPLRGIRTSVLFRNCPAIDPGVSMKIAAIVCLALFAAGKTWAADSSESAQGTFKSQGITMQV